MHESKSFYSAIGFCHTFHLCFIYYHSFTAASSPASSGNILLLRFFPIDLGGFMVYLN